MRILVVDEDPVRSADVIAGLEEAGHLILAVLDTSDDLRAAIARLQPDIIVIDLDSPYRDYLEDLIRINRENPRPIAMFVGEHDRTLVSEAIETGVSVYAVDGLSAKLVHSVLEIATAQFARFKRVHDELERSRTALGERKLVERAKGLLMAHRGFDEDQAYRALRKMAMDQNKRIGEIAQTVLTLADMLKK